METLTVPQPPATVLQMPGRSLALLAALVAALAPGVGLAAVPVSLYPLRIPGMKPVQRADVHALIQASLISGARRQILQPRTRLLLPVTCGETPSPKCLGAAARDGLVLAGHGERRSGMVIVTVALYDRTGARTQEVTFPVDLVIENLRPITEALIQLEAEIEGDGLVSGGARIPPPPARIPPPPASVAKAAGAAAIAAVPLPPPPSFAKGPAAKPAPAPIDVSAPAGPAPVWKRQAGPFFTILGGALLAGGAVVGLVNKSLANDLDAKHAAGTLTPADASSYDQVHRNNVISTTLLAAGAVSVAAGTWIWITAPARPGDPALAVAGGRF